MSKLTFHCLGGVLLTLLFSATAVGQTERKLTASDAAAGDSFGSSVSVNGDTATVGAALDDDAGTFSGSAYIFFGSPVPVELQGFSID